MEYGICIISYNKESFMIENITRKCTFDSKPLFDSIITEISLLFKENF